MVKIDIRSLKSGVHEYQLDPTMEDLGIEEPAFSDIEAHIRLDVDVKQIFVRVHTRAVASLVCDRTLVDFDQPVRGTWTVCYMPPADIAEDNEDEDLLPLPSGTEELDLTNIVRDTLMLSVPIRKIAPGADEQDIPTRFGEATESDIDPRWRALEKLKSGPDENPE